MILEGENFAEESNLGLGESCRIGLLMRGGSLW